MLDTKQLKEAQLITSRAKIAMFEAHPFYAHILTHLHFEFVEELPMNTISATNGKQVFIAPHRYLACTKDEQVSVLAHEMMHCLDGHIWRSGSRHKMWSNIAQDIYIYHVLKSEKFAVLTENERSLNLILQKHAKVQYDLSYYEGMFWEQIYDLITPEEAKSQSSDDGGSGEGDGESEGQGSGQGKPNPGSGSSKGKGSVQTDAAGCGHCYEPGKPNDDAKDEWKGWIREAGMYAKMAGATPGRWSELVDAATPKVPFETRFFEYLKRGLGGDQTYDNFSRRHLGRGEYLPSEVIETMGETVAVIDTSGSRDSHDIAYSLGVFRAWREMHPCKFHLVECDSENQGWQTWEEWDELPTQFNIKGRGGTSFEPPFNEVKEKKLEPSLLIFITDGYNYGDFAPKPNYPVLWVLTGKYKKDFAPPYGDVCMVEHPE